MTTFMTEDGLFAAKVIEDSIAHGVRLTTMEVTAPRPYLAEFNTHRDWSRNSASSRAIPTEINIERVRLVPYVPTTFNVRVKGMGVGEAFSEEEQAKAERIWLEARDAACDAAEALNEQNVDKSRANRLLEPFMWHTMIVTSTQWANFFALRCPGGDTPRTDFPAQLEVQQASILMRRAMRASTPVLLGEGDWHLPFITADEKANIILARETGNEEALETVMRSWCLISSRRLARVSFDKHTDTEPIQVSIDKAEELATGGHFSPMEHVATPISMKHIADPTLRKKLMVPADFAWELANRGDADPVTIGTNIQNVRCGNFAGWFQFRKTFEYEDDHSKLLNYEVM